MSEPDDGFSERTAIPEYGARPKPRPGPGMPWSAEASGVTRSGSEPRDSKVGLVLNDAFLLKRLIARGGMGEVYEAAEADGHPVAIKIVLPHLASDPRYKALFDRERDVLRLLSDPAIVQYRVFARDPNLGLPYIVMEFIDGPSLADALPSLKLDEQQLIKLTRRLASALSTAHELGLVHRDLSPSNILLPQEQLEKAKIIDFGIAKTLDAGTDTIIGPSFAGKLNYVAPEQFSERSDGGASRIGPWTDVYSLALVILAVATRAPARMGETVAEAFELRKTIPDLSALPVSIRPTFEKMLAPDPEKRMRSMGEVLQSLGRMGLVRNVQPGDEKTWLDSRPRMAWSAAAASVVLLLGVVAAVVLWFWPSAPPSEPHDTTFAAQQQNPGAAVSAEEVAADVAPSLANLDCTWLNLDFATGSAKPRIVVSGVSGNPAATSAFASGEVLSAAGTRVDIDTRDISPVQPRACGALNALRRFRESQSGAAASVNLTQKQFKLANDFDILQDRSPAAGACGSRSQAWRCVRGF